jgi:uncharacterized protein (DUF433 family)
MGYCTRARIARPIGWYEMVQLSRSPVRSDPEVMGGTLVFRATRVPVQSLLDYLDDGFTLDQFLDMFPSVEREDAAEFLKLARGGDHAHCAG